MYLLCISIIIHCLPYDTIVTQWQVFNTIILQYKVSSNFIVNFDGYNRKRNLYVTILACAFVQFQFWHSYVAPVKCTLL